MGRTNISHVSTRLVLMISFNFHSSELVILILKEEALHRVKFGHKYFTRLPMLSSLVCHLLGELAWHYKQCLGSI